MEEKKTRQPVRLYALAVALVVILDQALKYWVEANIPLDPVRGEQIPMIPGLFHLSHIRNSGVAFGMLQGGRWAFLVLLAVFCGLVVWAVRTGWLATPWERWLAVLCLGGALGNGIDRALHGYVVDMLEVEFMSFPVFNLADCAITVSAVLFVLLTLLPRKETETKDPDRKE